MRWIPVEEELPEQGIDVIVLLGFKREMQIASIQYENITPADHKLTKQKTWSGVHFNGWVTHWIPMPDYPVELFERA